MSIDHASGLRRRTFVKSLALAAAVPRLAWAGSAVDTGTGVTRMFALADIHAKDTFVERKIALHQYSLKAAIRRGIAIKLVAATGRRTSALFGLRLLRTETNEDAIRLEAN